MAAEPARRLGEWCAACGSRLIDPAAETCPRCEGVVLPPEARRRKSRIAAAVIAFLFGGVGAHRFYLGQSGLGTVYLLFCWTLVPGVVSLVDFIRLVAMTDGAFAARYGRIPGGGAAPAAMASAVGLVGWGAVLVLVVPRLLALVEAVAALPR